MGRCWDVDEDGRSSGVLCDEEPVALRCLLAATLPIVTDPDLPPLSHNKLPPTASYTMPPSISAAPSTPLLSRHPARASPLPHLRRRVTSRLPPLCTSEAVDYLPGRVAYEKICLLSIPIAFGTF
jgi:hypothetical protein